MKPKRGVISSGGTKLRGVAPAAGRQPPWRGAGLIYASVAAGSVIGGSLRYLASLAMQPFGAALPWSTLFVNVTGSLLIGLYAALTGPDGRFIAGPRQRHFVMTGICGGYTTFSAFSLETLRLIQAGNMAAAGINVALSVIGSLVAVWLGYAWGTRFNRLRR